MAVFDTSAEVLARNNPTDPLQHALASREADIPRLVTEALAQDRARLVFMPVVAASGGQRIAFHEGLIRLLDENGRLIPAGSFMAEVEETGLGRDIDATALRLGINMLQVNPHLRLAINMSARSIGDGTFRRTLEDGIRRTPRIGERLILEISENSAMLMPEVVIRFMAEFRPHGITFALDDFGAGLTAFRYLRDFLFDMVKIDTIFIRGIHASPDNQVVTEALVSVAHQFGMFAVAEGVETADEAAFLQELGVDCLQGYLFGVPSGVIS
ncbi:EAL domain-containing protein [Ketogulonicigenium vulgare]|uniref:Diguanylate phosphodiesterase n=1 Tax=Ketogulonicigenium vulgare (strain WSH-001) TaxID=759362 RepID=F9Y8E9_KETVW|nr:EAL domain-containing protein [Ketogulonicigenium vulgare]ADO41723.1 diguanylate phosphodiesterase [Ketogulonicigenium vulgare Y25]AEM39958.1 Diguanylate phosphodiesterase [Ketogulonicigenium vulgare WSH-001]ALJ80168.1 diguanylate phosphodiesterase [Ketogulonicigenium vulgare]ANW33032.1 diguanylate phosphodiesterase [Ketogulonicigenium vulgare]AOZ53654.1 diguanylate phosphodiesterase [Ketogulonicigenium vulgare]